MAISLANKHNWRAKGWSQAAVLSCTNIWCIFKQSLTHLRIKLSGSCNPQQGGNNYCHFSHHQASRSHKVVESRDFFVRASGEGKWECLFHDWLGRCKFTPHQSLHTRQCFLEHVVVAGSSDFIHGNLHQMFGNSTTPREIINLRAPFGSSALLDGSLDRLLMMISATGSSLLQDIFLRAPSDLSSLYHSPLLSFG